MSNLDINTPRGRETLWEEVDAIQIIKAQWPGTLYVHTDKEGPAAVDAIIIRHERIFAVAETKCRQMTLSELRQRFNYEWLVTYDKIKRGAQAADLLDVVLWGFLYLVPDKVLLRIKLYYRGQWLVPIRTAHTETQKTVNGGKIVRENAYITMTKSGHIAMKLHPWTDVVDSVDGLLKKGLHIYQQWNCAHCGAKQTMDVPDRLYTGGICEECGERTDIVKDGCNYMVHAEGQEAVEAVLKALGRGKP